MRRHKDPSRRQPKQKTTQARKTTQAQKTPTTPTAATTATSTGALHPIRGTTPDMGRCTRYVAVHPNRRGALPTDRVQCLNKQEQTRNWHNEPLTAAPLHAQLGPTGGRTGTPPTPPPAPRPTPTPPTPLHAKSQETPTSSQRGRGPLCTHGVSEDEPRKRRHRHHGQGPHCSPTHHDAAAQLPQPRPPNSCGTDHDSWSHLHSKAPDTGPTRHPNRRTSDAPTRSTASPWP